MKYRAEIDGLRALAVLPVIFFHAGFNFAHRGFLGVDIFFVISGFLITSIILSDLEQGRFSFARFYDRRIRRIMPALLFVFLVVLVFARFVMLPDEIEGFGKSLLASMVFCANFFFANLLGDYFSPDAHLQPLLHIWSLAVEEQFYIIFPILLLVLARFRRSTGIFVVSLISLASLALCLIWGKNNQIWNFYMMPTRFWELAAGALLAMGALDKRNFSLRTLNILSGLGLALIVYSYAAIPKNGVFPGLTTIPIILGTVLVLGFARADTAVGRMLSFKPLVMVGLVSYSAYLWHQPLFVFARLYSFEAELSKLIYWGLIALTFVFAGISWYFIEQPFRKKGHTKWVFGVIGLFSAIIIVMGCYMGYVYKPKGALADLKRNSPHSIGLDKFCDSAFDERCLSAKNPKVLVWGDSFAIQLVEALKTSKTQMPFAQYTKNGCAPIFGYSWVIYRANMDWTRTCERFNQDLKPQLKTMPDLKYVILASPFNCLEQNKCEVLRAGKVVPVTFEQLVDDMKQTLKWLREQGYEPVIMAPTPPNYDDLDRAKTCTVRSLNNGGNAENCALNRKQAELALEPIYTYLKAIEAVAPVVYILDDLCDDTKCPTVLNGKQLYLDKLGHFTRMGAQEFGQKTDIFKRIIDAADAFYDAHPIDKNAK